LDEFTDLFTKLTSDNVEPDQNIYDNIGQNLRVFDNDKEKNKRVELADILFKKVLGSKLIFTSSLFDSIIFILAESQQWRMIQEAI